MNRKCERSTVVSKKMFNLLSKEIINVLEIHGPKTKSELRRTLIAKGSEKIIGDVIHLMIKNETLNEDNGILFLIYKEQ